MNTTATEYEPPLSHEPEAQYYRRLSLPGPCYFDFFFYTEDDLYTPPPPPSPRHKHISEAERLAVEALYLLNPIK
jgi:hypothetical protein